MFVFMSFLIIFLKSGKIKGELELHAFKTQTANCFEKTVLQCNISSSVQLDINQIFWKKDKDEDFYCDAKSNHGPPGFECNYTRKALTLTILHPTPAKMGKYFCCFRADSGHGYKEITVSLGECSEEFSFQRAGHKQKECSFTGVYPKGTIHWFHFDQNVTSNSTLKIENNTDGTFNISSVLKIEDHQNSYNCSLWSLQHGQYLKNQDFEVSVHVDPKTLTGISTQYCLSWTLLLLALMFSLRTCLSLSSL